MFYFGAKGLRDGDRSETSKLGYYVQRVRLLFHAIGSIKLTKWKNIQYHCDMKYA